MTATVGGRWQPGGGLATVGRGELGMKPLQNLSVFAFAEKTNADWQAGLGARLTW